MSIVNGTKYIDVLRGVADEDNQIWGHRGDDTVIGGKHDDTVLGGKGDDALWGDRGNDTIFGNTGNDKIWGSINDDRLSGGDGNDWLSGGKDNDIVLGGKGDDEAHGNSGNDIVLGGSGNDVITGNSGNDILNGGRGDDKVSAGSGDDYVQASSGNDLYSGGSGFDTLDFGIIKGKLMIDVGHHTASVTSGKSVFTDVISGFEQIIGTDFGNHMMGADNHADYFVGGKGEDWMRGKGGSDTLTGGDGADTFAYLKKDTANGAIDHITDFVAGQDHLDMKDFLKGHTSYDSVVRVAESGADTLVQGLVNHQWVNVAVLDNTHIASIHDLGLLA